jgi:ribonuclease P protein subunit RPR2
MRHGKPAEHRDLAIEHVQKLFEQAEGCKDAAMANRYMQLARRISLKFKLRLPSPLRRRVCKHCHHYLRPGVNCRVRVERGRVITLCLDCRHIMRYPIRQRTKAAQAPRRH